MTASNHFLATSNIILGIEMFTNAKELTSSIDFWPLAKILIENP